MEEYKSKAVTTKISASSKVTLKVRDNFYSVEFFEEREVPPLTPEELEKERRILFDEINNTVDAQREDILKLYSHKK